MKYVILSGVLLTLFFTIGCGSKTVDSTGRGDKKIQEVTDTPAEEPTKIAQNDGGFMPVPGPDGYSDTGSSDNRADSSNPNDIANRGNTGSQNQYGNNYATEEDMDSSYATTIPADSLYTIYFDFDKYNIRNDMKPYIKADAEYIKQQNINAVVLQGNTDEFGTDEYNFALGQKRAISVRDALVLQGLPKEMFSTVSFGASKPVCKEKSPECHAQNRRTDIVEKQ